MRRTGGWLIVFLALVAAPAQAASRAERATHAAVSAAIRNERAVRAADAAGERRVQTVRTNAKACLDTVKAVPLGDREILENFYFNARSGGYWVAQRPLYERFVRHDLLRAARLDPTWRAVQKSLLEDLGTAEAIYDLAVPDICPELRQWQAANFATNALPPTMAALQAVFARVEAPESNREAQADYRLSEREGRLVRRFTSRREQNEIGATLFEGIDIPDDYVEDGEDPVQMVIGED